MPHRSSNKCLVKVAHMCAMLQQFDKAAALFEEVHLELNYFEFLTHKIIVLPISLLVFRLVRIHLRVHY